MNKNEKILFKICRDLSGQILAMLRDFRVQNYTFALWKETDLIENLTELDNYLQTPQQKELQSILMAIYQAQETRDYILMADYFELQMIPFLTRIQESLISLFSENEICRKTYLEGCQLLLKKFPEIAKKIDLSGESDSWKKEGYEVEYTSSGHFTLAVTRHGRRWYLHSNYNPESEAGQLADYWYDPLKKEYVIFGIGLGYVAAALLEKDSDICIRVYESDIHMIELALAYGCLGELLKKPQFYIVYDFAGGKIKKALTQENVEFIPFYPSIANVEEETFREWLRLQFIQYQAVKNQRLLLLKNFRENSLLSFSGLTELQGKGKGKRAFIISAGPSLDNNYLELKRKQEGDLYFAVSPVLKKLLKAKIMPDFVVISDCTSRKKKEQMEGIETAKIPLLFLATASVEYVRAYQGRRYMLCQKDFEPAEKLAAKEKWPLVETGGSVAVVAVSAAILLGVSEIIFVGQDLSYTSGKRHALDTSGTELYLEDGLKKMMDINGNLVSVPENLNLFRICLEQLVEKNSHIHFYNATEGGVPIRGVSNVRLKDVFETNN